MGFNILFTISEVVSFAKTGGLADFGEALPKALKKLGHNIIVVMPKYDCEAKGFEWIDELDYKSNVISFMRKSDNDFIIIVCNFSGITREIYRIGVPEEGIYKEIFNSQYKEFGGLDIKNEKPIKSEKIECHGRENSISLTLPPLSVIYLKKL